MADDASAETALDLAARLRAWVDANGDAPESLGDLLARAASGLEQTARGEEVLDEELKNERHVTYKEVLATRGERHRPDGTPLWPLRPDDFPSTFKESSAAARPAQTSLGDLPDWML